MILVGNQRGGAGNLAQHLLKEENERVELHELRGFVSENLPGAFNEAYGISRGTRCKQFLFSLSLNPPPGADVANEDFVRAIDLAENRLGLSGQPRAVVFHEKHGDDGELRRHAHAVWSRIDAEEMKAIQLSHSHRKLQDVSRELYLEYGWKMPRGLAVTGERDPRNFTLEEWQQAKRAGDDPREIKDAFRDAWAISDSSAAFSHALEERGYRLARGDRRGYVAVDHRGEVYAVAKWAGIKTKEVRGRLGDEATLPALADAKLSIAQDMQRKMEEFQREEREQEERGRREAEQKRLALEAYQRAQDEALAEAARLRAQEEERHREERFTKGLQGLWDWMRGEHKRITAQNQMEAEDARRRDEAEREALATLHREQQEQAAREEEARREKAAELQRSLEQDAKTYQDMETESRDARREAFKERRASPEHPEPERTRGPVLKM